MCSVNHLIIFIRQEQQHLNWVFFISICLNVNIHIFYTCKSATDARVLHNELLLHGLEFHSENCVEFLRMASFKWRNHFLVNSQPHFDIIYIEKLRTLLTLLSCKELCIANIWMKIKSSSIFLVNISDNIKTPCLIIKKIYFSVCSPTYMKATALASFSISGCELIPWYKLRYWLSS